MTPTPEVPLLDTREKRQFATLNILREALPRLAGTNAQEPAVMAQLFCISQCIDKIYCESRIPGAQEIMELVRTVIMTATLEKTPPVSPTPQ